MNKEKRNNILLMTIGISQEVMALFIQNYFIEFIFIVLGAISIFWAGFSFGKESRNPTQNPS